MRLVALLLFATIAFAQAPVPPPLRYVVLPVPVGTTAGAFGSVWSNELWVYNANPNAVSIRPEPCLLRSNQSCSLTIAPGETIQVKAPPEEWAIPYSSIETSASNETLHFSFRTRDLSRSSDSAGTEIPVIKENRLLSGRVELLNVSHDARFRVMLRILTHPFVTRRDFNVRVFSITGSVPLVSRHVAVQAPILPAIYGGRPAPMAAISDLLVEVPEAVDRLRIEVEPLGQASYGYWAFVSVTNNETQHVTTITPQ